MSYPADLPFYGILTDPVVGYERLAATMVERGVRVIQLRIKDAAPAEVRATAARVRRVIPAGFVFIVNDDPEVARDAGADGVHLGQQDAAYQEARALLGPGAVIGLSTHTPQQTRAACALGPDYIGVGPVFPTPTKAVADPAIGLDGMAAMLREATVPAVVLGGIDAGNVERVVRAGARTVCAVRAVNRATDPGQALDELLGLIARARSRA